MPPSFLVRATFGLLAPLLAGPCLAQTGQPDSAVAFATQPDNVALDGEGRYSPFTAALLKHIRTPGLKIEALMLRVRGEVATATKGKQYPRVGSGIIGELVLATAPRTGP